MDSVVTVNEAEPPAPTIATISSSSRRKHSPEELLSAGELFQSESLVGQVRASNQLNIILPRGAWSTYFIDLTATAMEEEFHFLLCQGCQKEPRNHKLLFCLHNLCTNCLEVNKPMGQCTICHTPIPQTSGIPDQHNLLFANLQAKLSTYQITIKGSDLVCDNCGQGGEFWCSDCEECPCIKRFETLRGI
ncbi:unnamed protein product [Lepidochelys kempii]